MVCVPKKSSDGSEGLRICVDLTALKKYLQREARVLPSTEECLGRPKKAKVVTKLDANSGYWQIPLTEESLKLTTFLTPFGQYFFRDLPFRITSASEIFQARMEEIMKDIKGVIIYQDDVIVAGSSQDEHDRRLRKAQSRLQDYGITLNYKKCKFCASKISFLGSIIDSDGIHMDPSLVESVTKMPVPKTVSELRRLLGMTQQLGKHLPELAVVINPLTEILKMDKEWSWGAVQDDAVKRLKEMLSEVERLTPYDTDKPTKVSADASNYAIGGYLAQQQSNGQSRPVAYASRKLTETELRYSQIEKEALSLSWACDRFKMHLVGKQFTLENDHKPLLTLLNGQKPLTDVPRGFSDSE